MGREIQSAVLSIAGQLDPSVTRAIQGAQKSFKTLKVGVIAAGAAIGASSLAAGKYLLDLGNTLDGAYDAIRVGTGATGEALESLKDDFKSVYSQVPGDAEQAAQAVADFNTRLGLSGDQLQAVSKRAIYLSNNLGAGELGGIIESSSKAFQIWNISADDMGGKMDYLFKVSQSTGTAYNTLAQTIQQNGMTLREIGFDFDTSAAFIGQMDKAGVNVSETMSAMKKALEESAKAGVSASDAYRVYYEDIMNAKDSTEAAAIASELFGGGAAPQMALAIRSGALSADELTKSLQESGETIEGCSVDTMDYAEKMQLMKQRMQIALAPLGESVFDSINSLMPVAERGIQFLIPIIQKIGENIPAVADRIAQGVNFALAAFEKAKPYIITGMQEIGKILSKAMEVAGTVAKTVLPYVKTALMGIADTIKFVCKNLDVIIPIVGAAAAGLVAYKAVVIASNIAEKIRYQQALAQAAGLRLTTAGLIKQTIAQKAQTVATTAAAVAQKVLNFAMMANPIGLIIAAVVVLAGVFVVLYKKCEPFRNFINGLGSGIKKGFIAVVDWFKMIPKKISGLITSIGNFAGKVKEKLSAVGAVIKNIFSGAFSGLQNLFSDPVGFISGSFDRISGAVSTALTAVAEKFPALAGVIQGVRDTIAPLVEGIKNIFSGMIDFVQNVFAGNWAGAWEAVKDIFSAVFSNLTGIIKIPLNGVISVVNKVIGAINGIKIEIPDWVPALGGKTLGFSLPQMPMLATGGIATQPTIVGEGGFPEYVISTDPRYKDNSMRYLGEAAAAVGASPVTELKAPASTAVSNYSGGNSYGGTRSAITIEYKPVITINGGDEQTKDSLLQLFDEHSRDLAAKIKSILAESEVGSYEFQW